MSASPLQDRRAVVTGGSRGIGLATARLLAEAGAAVVVCARSAEAVEEAAAGLRAAGHRAAGVPCDVTDETQVEALRAAAEEALGGGVDVLVNNAGAADSAPLARTSLATWNRLMAVNATGTFLCTRAFAPAMAERGWGRVVNVASVAGKAGAPYVAAYVAAKHAAVGFTRAVAAELAASGVTVNAVCPGYVDTEMTAESVARIAGTTRLDEAAARRALEKQSPQGRIYTAEEVAYQVLALCDPRAGGVNGQAVVLDGGRVQS